LSYHLISQTDKEMYEATVRKNIPRHSRLGQLDDLGFALTQRDGHHLHVRRATPDIGHDLHRIGGSEVDEHDVRSDFTYERQDLLRARRGCQHLHATTVR